MKKTVLRRALFLLLALLTLCLCACSGGNLKITSETEESGTAATAETAAPGKEYTVGTPYTRDMLEAIPISNNRMSSDELRAICLKFARMQCSIPWISAKDIKYHLETSASDRDGNLVFKEGVIYGGLPYTAAGSSLYTFMDYLDEETGLLDESMTNRVGDLLGNNCCTSLFWAWARVSSTITFTHTQVLVPTKGMIPLGSYTFDQTIDSYKEIVTRQICKDNGAQTIYESYAKLLLADGVVVNNQADSSLKGNHVRMVAQLPVVVRNDDGTINGKESYVIFVEQDEVLRPYTLENGLELTCEGHIDSKYSFEKMFEDGYIPFTIPEFLDPSSVQQAAATVDFENGSAITLKEFSNGGIRANYALSKVNVTVKDEAGNESDFSFYVRGVAHYTTDFSSHATTMERQLKAGSYTIEITALVGSGETVPVFTGTLVKE